MQFELIAQLVSVCHQWSITGTWSKFSAHLIVSGSARSPARNNDLKEAADALTDILYVTYGAGHAFGINLDKCFDEVQRSNMSKLDGDGKPIYNESGKVMKGPKYFKPDLSKFLK